MPVIEDVIAAAITRAIERGLDPIEIAEAAARAFRAGMAAYCEPVTAEVPPKVSL